MTLARVALGALALVLSACAVTAPVDAVPATTTTTTTTSDVSTTTVAATSTTSTLPSGWSVAGRADGELPVYDAPGDDAPVDVLSSHTDLGTPRVVLVLDGPTREGWAQVSLPVRPNGSTGWIEVDDVELFEIDRRVEVDLGDRTLVVKRDDEVLLETPVAIGGSGSPTPVGSFFVTDSVIVSDPDGPWGPHAFGLSAYSDTITEFNGGEGIIGIHGTNRADSIGTAGSLGCVRVPNDVARRLAGLISAGVPVDIVR